MKAGEQTRRVADDLKTSEEGWRPRPLIISLLLAVATFAVYWPVRQCGFLGYDDPAYFSENVHVLGGLKWNNVVWAFTTGEAANWHPLTWLSHMLDAVFFDNHPAGPHLVNLLFHAANVVLLFLLGRRLTGATGRSALVAALFALHPLHVESVAWISERKDLLCAFFMLLTLLAYACHATRDESRVTRAKAGASLHTRHTSGFYFLSLFFFACALMSKPMAVTLPFLLLLLDWWPLKRIAGCRLPVAGWKKLLPEKIPFLALSAAACAVTFVVQQKGGTVATLAKFSLLVRIENAFVSYARYLAKTIWPATLANLYPHPGHWPVALVILSGLLFAVLSVAAFWLARRFPYGFTGWFWFAGMLVPVIGLVQVGDAAMADRYAYMPMIGLLMILAWGLAELAGRWQASKTLVAVAVFLMLAASALKTRVQLVYWQNDGTLFGHTLAVTKNNYIASINLGAWLSKNGQVEAALEQYHAALQMCPDEPIAWYDVGNALAKLGHWDEAVADYDRALKLVPGAPDILNNLGFALMARKQLPEAITNFEAALAARPDFANAHNNLATARFKQGRFEAAAEHFYAAVKLAPDNPLFCANLGDALVRMGKTGLAEQCYQTALQLDPGNQRVAAKLSAMEAVRQIERPSLVK